MTRTPPARPWWRDAVIYQVYVRSFADSGGDGVGDLPGIRSRLPYLHDLGIDALWITPFYPSPMVDGGYDVADYRGVEPLFGTLTDADALLTDAHALGLRVIIDLVPNHTSDWHAWFQAALAAGPGSRERARYVFRRGRGPAGSQPPTDWRSVFGGRTWERLPDGDWYLHLFAPEQPDLNWRNPQVWEEFRSVIRFWLDRGMDGFRIDVAHGLMKDPAFPDLGGDEEHILGKPDRENHPFWDRDDVHEVYREWRRILDSYAGERIAVAEAWVRSPERMARYVRPDEVHQAFNFAFLLAPWDAAVMRQTIDSSLASTGAVGATTTWVLSNHDVTRHVTRYGDGEQGLRRARAAALLMLALPGSAYIYQGEELGLPEVTDLPAEVLQDPVWERSRHTDRGRDGCRVPMPWAGETPPFGFGPAGSDASWLPVPAEWKSLTVEAQTGSQGSMLELYRAALRARRDHPALGGGTMRWLASEEEVLAFAREPGFVCAVNFGTKPVELPAYGKRILASGPVGGTVLPPETGVWYSHP